MTPIRHLRRSRKKQGSLWLSLCLGVCLCWIPINIAIAQLIAPQPQAILMLGGGGDREEFTAYFAKDYPDLDVWISSGKDPTAVRAIFAAAKSSVYSPQGGGRLRLDYSASDTVTNFTTLVAPLQQQHIRHVFLITSEYHMPRARTIATFVFGSQGIAVTPIASPSNEPQESVWRTVRDAGRSILWIVTRHTGASFNSER